jgi:5-methylcytosine-specific restriction endonuclease McrA
MATKQPYASRKEYLRQWEKQKHQELRNQVLNLLGPTCRKCGATENLEFDHVHDTKAYVTCRMSRLHRHRVYLEEAKRGELQILCAECNRLKGKPPPPPVVSEMPF